MQQRFLTFRLVPAAIYKHHEDHYIRAMWHQLDCIMRPSSLGGGRILRRTLSVRLSVRPVIVSVTSRHLANYNDTHVLFGRAAYRTASSAAQILVFNQLHRTLVFFFSWCDVSRLTSMTTHFQIAQSCVYFSSSVEQIFYLHPVFCTRFLYFVVKYKFPKSDLLTHHVSQKSKLSRLWTNFPVNMSQKQNSTSKIM